MRIPHIINSNTLAEYKPSPESLDLLSEIGRKLVPEDFEWNKYHCPTLADFCVGVISKNFERNPLLDELPCEDRDHLLEILSPDLPLEVAIPHIHDEYYWQRRYAAKFGLVVRRKPPDWTWKSLYLERYVQEILEQAQPQYNDEETFDEILNLCCPFVSRIFVTQLQSWKPPLTMEKEDIPEKYPIEHINFMFIFRKLPQITEFNLIYGVNSVGEDFSWDMFKISVADCQRLGKALLDLSELKILRIHRSRIQYMQCQALMQNLIRSQSLVELDLSHCEIGDDGALCVAKVLRSIETLRILNLTNNNIGARGVEGIGFVMLQVGCADLDVINLRLNPLQEEGVMTVLRTLVRSSIPREICLSGCNFGDDTPSKLAMMFKMNDTLKKLDISNNWIGEEGGALLVQALDSNSTLEWLDVRETDMTAEQMEQIEKILNKNRNGSHQGEEEQMGEEEEEIEKVIDYFKSAEIVAPMTLSDS